MPIATDGVRVSPSNNIERINATITGVTVPAGGGAPTVTLLLTDDSGLGIVDLPAGNIRFAMSQLTPGSNGSSSEWQSYITLTDGGIEDAQATTETATISQRVRLTRASPCISADKRGALL